MCIPASHSHSLRSFQIKHSRAALLLQASVTEAADEILPYKHILPSPQRKTCLGNVSRRLADSRECGQGRLTRKSLHHLTQTFVLARRLLFMLDGGKRSGWRRENKYIPPPEPLDFSSHVSIYRRLPKEERPEGRETDPSITPTIRAEKQTEQAAKPAPVRSYSREQRSATGFLRGTS